MNTTITASDVDADHIRELLQQAQEHGATALTNVGQRISLLCTIGEALEQRRGQRDFQTWLGLHFLPEELSSKQAGDYVRLAKARRVRSLDLDTRKGLTQALAWGGLLPGFDGYKGAKKPVSYVSVLAKLHVILNGLRPWEWSEEERAQVKSRLQCVVDVWAKL